MTYVASFASTKGGVGKTTGVMALASEFRRLGRSVLILDCDPNKPHAKWAGRAGKAGITVIDGVTESNVRQLTQEHAPAHDFTLIDLAGFGNLTMLYAFSVSDLVVIPTQQSRMDVEEAIKTHRVVLDSAGVLRHTPLCYILMTRTQAAIRARVDEHSRGLIREQGVPAFRTELIDRSIFKEMTYNGFGPGEVAEGSNAHRNVEALAEEFCQVLAAAPLNPLIERRQAKAS
ncbi:MAG TPA: ParA family protein [Alphaproteobacteria bacterium]|nr:ParA family protein [Alphaproteobacteria bacterium]